MSLQLGLAAFNLDMPPIIPRTEYSAHKHWNLVRSVTGIDVEVDSDNNIQQKASSEFVKRWDYSFFWSVFTLRQHFGDLYTRMGHAEYESGGIDYSANIICPFDTPEKVLTFDPFGAYGIFNQKELVENYNKHYEDNIRKYPDVVNMTGIYITCISGLLEIFGWEMFLLAAGIDIKKFGNLTNSYCRWAYQFFEALAKCKSPVIMVHDDIAWTSGPFLAPDWYREFVFPNYKYLFQPLVESGKKIVYTSDGDYTVFVDDIAECGVHGFVLEPCADMSYVATKYGKSHVFFGNADTRVLLTGTKDDIRNEVKRCIDIGKEYPGFFMAVGNHIPANTPLENALYYNEVFLELAKRGL
jgi:hypothetical protein